MWCGVRYDMLWYNMIWINRYYSNLLKHTRVYNGIGASVHTTNKFEMTALSVAAVNGKRNMVEFFLSIGADINKPSREGEKTW